MSYDDSVYTYPEQVWRAYYKKKNVDRTNAIDHWTQYNGDNTVESAENYWTHLRSKMIMYHMITVNISFRHISNARIVSRILNLAKADGFDIGINDGRLHIEARIPWYKKMWYSRTV